MSTTVKPPYDIFLDTTGKPLDNGRIYIGEINANPETTPILVYYDRAQTIPAPNPVTTIGGYPSRAGSAASLFVSGGYSILVKDKNGVVVFHSATNSDDSADGQAIQIKNYFDNSTFETGTTTGWNLGKDSGTTTPLSGGIGGGATDFLPLSINGSSPLAGSNSLLLNKATGNAQGSTLYTDNMTVELEDVGAEMYIGFSYITPSVGYTTGDLSAFLWDVTGGALVTLSSNAVPASAGVAAKFTASATLPAGRTTFRFILMFTNAANLAEISIELDSFAFSPYTFADAATTGYVDAAVASHAALTNPHSATSAATASRLMLRDASGNVSVNQLTSVVTTGTAPFVVASTTLVSNLNAERLNGQLGSYYLPAASYTAADVLTKLLTVDTDTSGINATTLKSITIGQTGTSYIPYANANGNALFGTTTDLLAGRVVVVGAGAGTAPASSGTTDSTVNLRTQRASLTTDIGQLNSGNGYIQTRNSSDLSINYSLILNPNGGSVLVGNTTGTYHLDVRSTANNQFSVVGEGTSWGGAILSRVYSECTTSNPSSVLLTVGSAFNADMFKVVANSQVWVNRSTDDGSGAVLQVNGGISATTQASSDNSTKVATTAFVRGNFPNLYEATQYSDITSFSSATDFTLPAMSVGDFKYISINKQNSAGSTFSYNLRVPSAGGSTYGISITCSVTDASGNSPSYSSIFSDPARSAGLSTVGANVPTTNVIHIGGWIWRKS